MQTILAIGPSPPLPVKPGEDWLETLWQRKGLNSPFISPSPQDSHPPSYPHPRFKTAPALPAANARLVPVLRPGSPQRPRALAPRAAFHPAGASSGGPAAPLPSPGLPTAPGPRPAGALALGLGCTRPSRGQGRLWLSRRKEWAEGAAAGQGQRPWPPH